MRPYFLVFLCTILPVGVWSQTPPSAASTPSASTFPNSVNWSDFGQNDSYPGRHFSTATVMNNHLWMIGGLALGKPVADVLSSADGLNWNLATDKAAFGPRWGQASLAFDAGQGTALWVIGGSDGKNFFNDVWQSQDGANWKLITANAPFAGRARMNAVVFNHKMWVTAGLGAGAYFNDIWSSPDGKTWTQVIPQSAFPARYSATLTVHHNALWLIGGQGSTGLLSDIWSSPDGVNWSAGVHPAFAARSSHTAEEYQGLLWVFGGHDAEANVVFNDAWWSANGSDWHQASALANYTPRWAHASAVFNGQVWLLNGANGPKTNPVDYSDIWDMGAASSGLSLTSNALKSPAVVSPSVAAPAATATPKPVNPIVAPPPPVPTATPTAPLGKPHKTV